MCLIFVPNWNHEGSGIDRLCVRSVVGNIEEGVCDYYYYYFVVSFIIFVGSVKYLYFLKISFT